MWEPNTLCEKAFTYPTLQKKLYHYSGFMKGGDVCLYMVWWSLKNFDFYGLLRSNGWNRWSVFKNRSRFISDFMVTIKRIFIYSTDYYRSLKVESRFYQLCQKTLPGLLVFFVLRNFYVQHRNALKNHLLLGYKIQWEFPIFKCWLGHQAPKRCPQSSSDMHMTDPCMYPVCSELMFYHTTIRNMVLISQIIMENEIKLHTCGNASTLNISWKFVFRNCTPSLYPFVSAYYFPHCEVLTTLCTKYAYKQTNTVMPQLAGPFL